MLFVDQIIFSSLLRLLALGRSITTIWHFESVAPIWQRVVKILRGFGVIRAELRQVDNHIGQVRNEEGEGQFVKLFGDARAISTEIKREQLTNNQLIRWLASEWEVKKILFYFEKSIEQEMQTECLRIGLVEWMLRAQLRSDLQQSALLIERGQWFSYLKAYAEPKGVRLISYGPSRCKKVINAGARSFRLLTRALPAIKRAAAKMFRGLPVGKNNSSFPGDSVSLKQQPASSLAIHYWFRTLSFDPTERSEFFWLNGSGVPFSEVLLYNYVTDRPLDDEKLRKITGRGVRLMGRGPGLPVWHPTPSMFKVLIRVFVRIFVGLLTSLASWKWVSPYYVGKLWSLAIEYAYWYDFYSANRVLLNVGTVNTRVGQVLALDALNGVTVSYQYSVSPILCPTSLMSSGEDVQFTFSPVFEELWRTLNAPVNAYVNTGFIYDSAIQTMSRVKRVAEVRKRLKDNGARFILCFFDENSLNRWNIYASDEGAATDYRYLLEWLLRDPSLGLIFKPKLSTNLFQRIDSLSELLEKARRTGRCQFLTSDTKVGNIYPAEAALMSDICIGKLDGSTAGMEARLAGVPTVLIDCEGFRSHPFYIWGRDRVVFKDWDSLHTAIEKYRTDPEAHTDFGDWSPELRNLDRFQDGQASLRMGLYIRWVYDALKLGEPKQTALQIAAEKYSDRWGNGHVRYNNQNSCDVPALNHC